jgi:hypothetical protein
MLPSIISRNGAQKRGPPTLIWDHTNSKMWAYFSPMIWTAYPTKKIIFSLPTV